MGARTNLDTLSSSVIQSSSAIHANPEIQSNPAILSSEETSCTPTGGTRPAPTAGD